MDTFVFVITLSRHSPFNSCIGGQTFYYNDKNGEFQWSNPENNASFILNKEKKAAKKAAKAAAVGALLLVQVIR